MIAWSFSRLHMFEECAKQLYHLNVAPRGSPDRVEFVQNQFMKDGENLHKALEQRIGMRVPLPPEYAQLEPICAAILAVPGQNYTELKLAIDQQMNACGNRDWDRVWLRVIIDLLKVEGDWAWCADYKSGKKKPDDDQLNLFAAVVFLLFPDVQRVTTSFVWTRDYDNPKGCMTSKDYDRSDAPGLWAEFIPRVEKLQIAAASNHWPASPSRENCLFCAVNKAGKCAVAVVKPWVDKK